MKAVILAGGLGSRLAEETATRPKPMVEVGERPILWHIMKLYSHYGVNDFVVCLGYKGEFIKSYFANFNLHNADVSFDLQKNTIEYHESRVEPWRVTLVDTGQSTMTGGRLMAVRDYLGSEDFCFTYGDGVGDVDIAQLIAFHRAHRLPATVTVARPPGRFGEVHVSGRQVTGFAEKRDNVGSWVNAGFFVLSPKVIDRIAGPDTSWELEPVHQLVADGQLAAYTHTGFWQPMDTVRDRNYLNELWASGQAPWKVWS